MKRLAFQFVLLLMWPLSIYALQLEDFAHASSWTNSMNNGLIGFEDSPYGTLILDFIAHKKTCRWHWFPRQELNPHRDDANNNLFANNGALYKLDQVCDSWSQNYESSHDRFSFGSGPEYAWMGHQHEAAIAACIFPPPLHKVVMINRHGRPVTFTPLDIQGLLIKIVYSLIGKQDVVGTTDGETLSPEELIATLIAWAREQMPFVADLDHGRVWTYPFDRVKIFMSITAPQGFDQERLYEDYITKFFRIEMTATGYPDLIQIYEVFVQYDRGGMPVNSGTVEPWARQNLPTRLMRPHAIDNLNNKESWPEHNTAFGQNPCIMPRQVFDIFSRSETD